MQSDFFDNKVKAAADHHHPAYDEQAWKQMEHLLDKHLPQKKEKKRRFLFIILFALLAGGGGWLLISQPWKPGDRTATTPKEETIADKGSTDKTATPVISNENPVETNTTNTTTEKTAPVTSENNKPVITVNDLPVVKDRDILQRKRRSDPLTVAIQKSKSQDKKNKANQPVSETQTTDASVAGLFPGAPTTENKPITANDLALTAKPDVTEVKKESTSASVKQDEKKTKDEQKTVVKTDETKIETPVANNNKTNKKKEKNKQPGPFFLSISAGPDLSFAGNNKWGDTRLAAGIGAGYTIKDRVTIRTGFYSGRKIYSAKPDNYNPPPEFWAFYPYLQEVDANCQVYEIPVSVSYNFGKSKKQQWFASAGASAYIMKEESYDYYYKYDPSSPVYHKNYTIKNENKHLLSVVTLSGGYKRNLSKRVFVMAEPYMKIPVSGVGYGKVKLNSAGVMFTIGVKPFNTVSGSKTPQP